MRIDNTFIVETDEETAWAFLTDLGKVAPCIPGASVDSSDGRSLKGRVTIRIGPISMTYLGDAEFVFKDDQARIATIEATGRDSRSGASVKATIKAELTAVEEGSRVSLSTDLNLTGRIAQLGKGPIQDFSGKILEQFANCLATTITAPAAASDHSSSTDGAPTVVSPAAQTEPLRLLDPAYIPTKAWYAVGGGLLAGLAMIWRLRRRRRAGRGDVDA